MNTLENSIAIVNTALALKTYYQETEGHLLDYNYQSTLDDIYDGNEYNLLVDTIEEQIDSGNPLSPLETHFYKLVTGKTIGEQDNESRRLSLKLELEHLFNRLKANPDKLYEDITQLVRDQVDELESIQDNGEQIHKVFSTGWKGLKGLTYSLDTENDNEPFVGYYEPDIALIRYDGEFSIELLLEFIAIIFSLDCTGCCNAVQWLRVSRQGLLAQLDVSNSYHS